MDQSLLGLKARHGILGNVGAGRGGTWVKAWGQVGVGMANCVSTEAFCSMVDAMVAFVAAVLTDA